MMKLMKNCNLNVDKKVCDNFEEKQFLFFLQFCGILDIGLFLLLIQIIVWNKYFIYKYF